MSSFPLHRRAVLMGLSAGCLPTALNAKDASTPSHAADHATAPAYIYQSLAAAQASVQTALQTRTGAAHTGALIAVQGYARPHDGGEAVYQVVTGAEAGGPDSHPHAPNLRLAQRVLTPEMFGATADGHTDDGPAIQSAINLARAQSGGEVRFQATLYHSAQGLEADGRVTLRGAGPNGMSRIDFGPMVTEAVALGKTTRFLGVITDLEIARAAFNRYADAKGWALYDVASTNFTNISSRLFNYPFHCKPGPRQRVGYNTFVNLVCVGGYRNMTLAPTGGGWVNENTFYSGRMVTTVNTETNVYWNGGNHNRFINISAEGSGAQAFYIGGHSNVVEHPRTEGVWTIDDIVIARGALRTVVIAHNLYTTVTDYGRTSTIIASQNSQIRTGSNNTHALDIVREGACTDRRTPVARIRDAYAGSGQSRGLSIEMARPEGEAIGCYSAAYGSVHTVSADGAAYTRLSHHIGQSGWNFAPLRLGDYVLWVDRAQRLRIKRGRPLFETDGVVVGEQE